MRRWVVWVLPVAMLVSQPASAYEQRSGTFSAGVQGQVTGLVSASGVYTPFEMNGLDGNGVGISIGFRINIDRKSAIGVTFSADDFERTNFESLDFEIAARDTAEPSFKSRVLMAKAWLRLLCRPRWGSRWKVVPTAI